MISYDMLYLPDRVADSQTLVAFFRASQVARPTRASFGATA